MLQSIRRAGFWVAALAVLVRAWLPAGYMAAPDDANRLTVILCGLGDRTEMVLDLATGALTPAGEHEDHGDDADMAAPCAFALATAAHLVSSDVATPAPRFAYPMRIAAGEGAFAVVGRPHPSPPVRGPPAFA